MNKVISREYVEKNYIHKDTIKKLLKRAEKEYENSGESTEYNVHKNYLYHRIGILKELLEETKDGNSNENNNTYAMQK